MTHRNTALYECNPLAGHVIFMAFFTGAGVLMCRVCSSSTAMLPRTMLALQHSCFCAYRQASKFKLPRVRRNRQMVCFTDAEFGRQYLAGQNPCILQQVTPEWLGATPFNSDTIGGAPPQNPFIDKFYTLDKERKILSSSGSRIYNVYSPQQHISHIASVHKSTEKIKRCSRSLCENNTLQVLASHDRSKGLRFRYNLDGHVQSRDN